MHALASKEDGQAVDMSHACMCETLDAIGLLGFDKVYQNLEAVKSGEPAEMLTVRTQPVILLEQSYILFSLLCFSLSFHCCSVF